GAAQNQVIGSVPDRVTADRQAKKLDPAQADLDAAGASRGSGHHPGRGARRRAEPLAGLQWDMQQIGATADGSYRYEQGRGLRAGQDSGFFFLQPSVDALTYAGDHGIDVVNMSYYVDPWLFNCTSNPADSPEAQAEQRTVIAAMQRALDYAYGHGVTLVAAAGNGATDYTKVIQDASSPDFAAVPGEAPYTRTIPPS